MLGGNNSPHVPAVFLEESHFAYQTNPSNQLQLLGNLPVGCSIDPINYFANEHTTPLIRPLKRGREADDITRQHKLQISLNNYNNNSDGADRSASIRNTNPVSTGLRLSYDDDERNSTVTSASGSMTATPSMLLPFGDSIRSELDRQKEEFDHYIKLQEEHLSKGIRDINQRHMARLLGTIEKSLNKKLQDKEVEIESINRKNRELIEKTKEMAAEAQSWNYRAKYNESVINVLKSNLQQAISNGAADQGKEGFGDSGEHDDAASHIDQNRYPNMRCRRCKVKEVSMLLMPCRHLCLCVDCDRSIGVCPVCQLVKTASVQVFLS